MEPRTSLGLMMVNNPVSHDSGAGCNSMTPKPLFLKRDAVSPKTSLVPRKSASKLTTSSGANSPSNLCKRNPRLYSHKKNVDLKAAKKRKGTLNESELFEIKDLDLKPNMLTKNIET